MSSAFTPFDLDDDSLFIMEPSSASDSGSGSATQTHRPIDLDDDSQFVMPDYQYESESETGSEVEHLDG